MKGSASCRNCCIASVKKSLNVFKSPSMTYIFIAPHALYEALCISSMEHVCLSIWSISRMKYTLQTDQLHVHLTYLKTRLV